MDLAVDAHLDRRVREGLVALALAEQDLVVDELERRRVPGLSRRIMSATEASADSNAKPFASRSFRRASTAFSTPGIIATSNCSAFASDVAAPGQLADDDARAVADERRVDVLVRARRAADGGDVHAALVRERAASDVRRVLVEGEVRDLGDEPRDATEHRQARRRGCTPAELQLEVRDDRS